MNSTNTNIKTATDKQKQKQVQAKGDQSDNGWKASLLLTLLDATASHGMNIGTTGFN